MGRELSDEFKLSVRTIGEVFEALSNQVTRLARDRSIRFCEKGKVKRPTKAAIVSALLLWLDEQPAEKQRDVMGKGMATLNRLLALDGEPTPEKLVAEDDGDPADRPKRKAR